MVENFCYYFEGAFAPTQNPPQRRVTSSNLGYASPVVVDPQLYTQPTQTNLPQVPKQKNQLQPASTQPAANWQDMFKKQNSRPKSKKLSGSVVGSPASTPAKKEYDISSLKKSGCLVCIF